VLDELRGNGTRRGGRLRPASGRSGRMRLGRGRAAGRRGTVRGGGVALCGGHKGRGKLLHLLLVARHKMGDQLQWKGRWEEGGKGKGMTNLWSDFMLCEEGLAVGKSRAELRVHEEHAELRLGGRVHLFASSRAKGEM
jgi:hypothetical protein